MLLYDPIIQNLKTNSDQQVDVLRLDLIHPEISGNKWFKLKRNIETALANNFDTIVTFGGAHSNHIAATAAACELYKLKCVGIIRGEENQELNPTLSEAVEKGMHLHFVSRQLYAGKNEKTFQIHLSEKFGPHYLIPEGGKNMEGVLGCTEIMQPDRDYDFIFCACGTATTYSGILASAGANQKVIGISVLKGENKLPEDSMQLLKTVFPKKEFSISGNEALSKSKIEDHFISSNYCFSGYAGFDKNLFDFKIQFEKEYQIPLDHVYTGKLFYAVFDLLRLQKFAAKAKILIVHSGGLQGNVGFEKRYGLR